MRVLLAHNFYQQPGGEDAVVRAEYDALRSRGVEVQLYARDSGEIRQYNWLQKAAIPLYTIASPRTGADIRDVVATFRPDVAYLHNLYPLISPSIYEALAAAGVPIVQAVHNYRPFCANALLHTGGQICERCIGGNHWNAVRHRCFRDSYVLSSMYAATVARARRTGLLRNVSAWVCLTGFGRQKLMEAGVPADCISVRPNSLDAAKYQPAFGGGEYVLFLGRLSAEKGVQPLLEAFRWMPGERLVIAGAGPFEEEARAFAAKHRMTNVEFAGFQSGEAKARLLAKAKFLVFPSVWYETFGMVILEAYAAGKPVVGSRIGSIPFLVRDGETGSLFEPGNSADMAAKMQALASDDQAQIRMGRAGRSCLERDYNLDQAFDSLMSIFAQVTGKPAGVGPVSRDLVHAV
jgi:glycosyltransferase involved in cell wall biosynthesis